MSDRNFESINSKNAKRTALAIPVAALALIASGCSPFGQKGSSESISDCPAGYTSPSLVKRPDMVVTAFAQADQQLLRRVRQHPGDPDLNDVFFQLYRPKGDGSILSSDSSTTFRANQLNLSQVDNLTDDPSDLLCMAERHKGGDTVLEPILSPHARAARSALAGVGIRVHLGPQVVLPKG